MLYFFINKIDFINATTKTINILMSFLWQSKKGALWSREPLDVPSFSSILKFRISGKGKDFFGDGIALWVVRASLCRCALYVYVLHYAAVLGVHFRLIPQYYFLLHRLQGEIHRTKVQYHSALNLRFMSI